MMKSGVMCALFGSMAEEMAQPSFPLCKYWYASVSHLSTFGYQIRIWSPWVRSQHQGGSPSVLLRLCSGTVEVEITEIHEK